MNLTQQRIQKQNREQYLAQCLKEIREAYNDGLMTRTEYLRHLKEEREEHWAQWSKEDSSAN